MRNRANLQKTTNIIFFLLIVILLFVKFSYSQEYVKTNKATNLYDAKNGKSIVWVNKGYKFGVIKKEGNWYLVRTHFGKITQAWLKEFDIEKDARTAINLDLFKKGRLLLKDEIGDISDPKYCDFKNLRINSDNKFIYFLIELAVGWEELFAKTRTTGSIGTIYLDVDSDRSTGYDGGITHVNRDGTEERRIREDDCRIGADYKIQIDTGFTATFQKSSSETTMIPNVGCKLYTWHRQDLDWEYLDQKEALFKENFIEVSIKRKDIELKKGQAVRLAFEEDNAFGDDKYNVVNFRL